MTAPFRRISVLGSLNGMNLDRQCDEIQLEGRPIYDAMRDARSSEEIEMDVV